MRKSETEREIGHVLQEGKSVLTGELSVRRRDSCASKKIQRKAHKETRTEFSQEQTGCARYH